MLGKHQSDRNISCCSERRLDSRLESYICRRSQGCLLYAPLDSRVSRLLSSASVKVNARFIERNKLAASLRLLYVHGHQCTPLSCRKADGTRTHLVIGLDTENHLYDLSLGVRGQRLPIFVGGAVLDLVGLVPKVSLRGPRGREICPQVSLCRVLET